MGHKHSRDEILAGAAELATEDGLSQLTFGRVAKRLGVSDRIVVYYFPTKDTLITEVIGSIGADLQSVLAGAVAAPVADHRDLVRQAWPVLTTPEADATFALFFEALGLAAAGRSPYRDLVPQLFAFWIGWARSFFVGPDEECLAEAEGAIALLDGLLLLRQMQGAEVANRAAAALGVN
ncbi:MAG: TetR/AcrR family transcriptional regulator [Actinomycetota bacterium]